MNDKIIEELLKPLPPEHVKKREQGGVNVSYIEAWQAIDTANRIFGHLQWNRETLSMREVCSYTNQKGNHVVGYEAKVRITIGDAVREGTGHGSGIARDLFSAIESAAKEAESDAMKRALMTFGYPLGLALYDKKKAHVGNGDDSTPEQPEAFDSPQSRLLFVSNVLASYDNAESKQALQEIVALNQPTTEKIKASALAGNEEDIKALNELSRAYKARVQAIETATIVAESQAILNGGAHA